jgi:hypothetical protein
MSLLEREHAFASLAEYAASAANGDGRVVLVSGEAGAYCTLNNRSANSGSAASNSRAP